MIKTFENFSNKLYEEISVKDFLHLIQFNSETIEFEYDLISDIIMEYHLSFKDNGFYDLHLASYTTNHNYKKVIKFVKDSKKYEIKSLSNKDKYSIYKLEDNYYLLAINKSTLENEYYRCDEIVGIKEMVNHIYSSM